MWTRASNKLLLDSALHNPRGFLRTPTSPARRGHLRVRDGVLVVMAVDGGRRVAIGPDGIVQGSARTLRGLHHLDLSEALSGERAARRPLATARLLATLAARGVPLVVGEMPSDVRAALHPDVVTALQSTTPGSLVDPLGRESMAIRQRRAVLRRHVAVAPRSVSVLVATRRPGRVADVAATVRRQQHVAAELVLVTHGFTLGRAAVRRVRRLSGVPVAVRSAAAELVFGDVLNVALATASGDIVTKMDDDDYYGPHHLEDLLLSLAWSGAELVGAFDEFSYLSRLGVTVRHRRPPRQEIRRRRVPGPTMTMRRTDLVALGGWAPVPAHVDRELNDAVHRAGATAHCTHGLGYLRHRHGDGHTWVASDEHFLANSSQAWRGLVPPPELYHST